jgi:CheY-like chemotaxis protein
MNRLGRVLVVDDLEQWRKVLVSTLQKAGYETGSAGTYNAALERMQAEIYHVVILDIRLVDEDQNNVEGIDLLRELEQRGLGQSFKIIILSAHGTLDQMREAFKEFGVADFLSKDSFTREIFLASVRQALDRENPINLDLTIHWQQVKGPEEAVHNLIIDGERVRGKDKSDFQRQLAQELDDLLCRLFPRARSLMVRPLTGGASGSGVLWAEPFYASGGGRAVIVKFGDLHMITREDRQFAEYVQPFIGGMRATSVQGRSQTPHLGGLIYTLLGADKETLEDFGQFYRRANVTQICAVLDRLFLDTCNRWYANPGHLQPLDLTQAYQELLGFTQESLEYGLQQMQKSVKGSKKLTFTELPAVGVFTDPISALCGKHLLRSTYTCITHGDFHHQNIFVDEVGQSWLIDFQATGPGHYLRDIAQLEIEVRLSLLTTNEATLAERLEMESALCELTRQSELTQANQYYSTQNDALAKTFAVTVHLRQLAYKLIAQQTTDMLSDYTIALIYYALNQLRFFQLPARQREHALLSASLLVDALKL